MTKNRLEAFSDGVFSIAITLLVLDIKLPETEVVSDGQLLSQLNYALPNLVTFIFSFLVVGVFWVAHHRIFAFIKHVDHYLLWSNIFYLMTIAIIPFPASVLAKHPFFATSVIFYSCILFLCGCQHFLFLRHIGRNEHLRESNFTNATYKRALKTASVGPGFYLFAIIFSFVNPLISFCFILAALIFYIFLAQLIIAKRTER